MVSISIIDLPAEIVHDIGMNLNFRDLVIFSHGCKYLYNALQLAINVQYGHIIGAITGKISHIKQYLNRNYSCDKQCDVDLMYDLYAEILRYATKYGHANILNFIRKRTRACDFFITRFADITDIALKYKRYNIIKNIWKIDYDKDDSYFDDIFDASFGYFLTARVRSLKSRSKSDALAHRQFWPAFTKADYSFNPTGYNIDLLRFAVQDLHVDLSPRSCTCIYTLLTERRVKRQDIDELIAILNSNTFVKENPRDYQF